MPDVPAFGPLRGPTSMPQWLVFALLKAPPFSLGSNVRTLGALRLLICGHDRQRPHCSASARGGLCEPAPDTDFCQNR